MLRLPIGFAALVTGMFLAGVAAGADSDTALLAAACTSCHGASGQGGGAQAGVPGGSGAIPALAGKPAADLLAALRDYRSGARAGTIMGRIAKGYTDPQLTALAGWYGGRP